MNEPIFVWGEHSEVYHQQPWASERCNVDDLVDRREGNVPPVDWRRGRQRRLCTYCRRAKQRAEGV